jgi:hypothetical protein
VVLTLAPVCVESSQRKVVPLAYASRVQCVGRVRCFPRASLSSSTFSRMTRRPPLLRRRTLLLQACAAPAEITQIVQCPAPSVPATHDASATALGLAADGCACSGAALTGTVACVRAAEGQPLNPCQTSQTCTGLEVNSVSGQITSTQVQISVAPGATPVVCTVPNGILTSRIFYQVSCRVLHQLASRSPAGAALRPLPPFSRAPPSRVVSLISRTACRLAGSVVRLQLPRQCHGASGRVVPSPASLHFLRIIVHISC